MRIAILLLGNCVWATMLSAAEPTYDVDVTLKNTSDRDFGNLPVFLTVSQVFGRGIHFDRLAPEGFRVYDDKGAELDVQYRAMPPALAGWPTQQCNRYRMGMLYAASNMSYWHHWYGNQFIGYHKAHKAFVRGANIVGNGEGMIDLRYFETLKNVIAEAKKQKVADREIAATEAHLKGVFDYCAGDWHWVGVYNGTPEQWGDDWFYDNWRNQMRQHALAITAHLRKN